MVNPSEYDYFLPQENLALSPAVPRDSSRLFIYDTAKDEISFDYFYNLDKFLPKDSLLVLNDTRVIPARVTMKKETGGKVVVLFLVNEFTGLKVCKVMADRKISVGEFLFFDKDNFVKVVSQKKHIFELEFDFSRDKLFSLLRKFGTMPIPPYLKKSPLNKDELLEKYQTIFARVPAEDRLASAAAPTASLHFTEQVFEKLESRGIEKCFVTLHVGLGTFAQVTDENIKKKALHQEYFEVESKALQCFKTSKSAGKKLIAVGTTVARTLETLAKIRNRNEKNKIFSNTDLFIYPPYDFKMMDCLITNFHLPKSSLMMLVEAFLKHRGSVRKLVDLYNIAISKGFRFYSFGDAMLII